MSTPSLEGALKRVREASAFVASVLDRPRKRGVKAREFETPYKAGALVKAVKAVVPKAGDEGTFMAALRVLRSEQMARIAVRDLAGWAPLDETLAAVSELAEACCDAALARAQGELAPRFGAPRDEAGKEVSAYVLGMGKLGGSELNFSSDIDLILGFTAPGATDGKESISNEEYFEKVTQKLTRYLGQLTADGFVFRVDWMLRPFGSAGAPAMHSAAMEEYYQTHGREWERYAFIKARPVAGDREAGAALLAALRPFIYRRYLDYNAIGALRELKRQIAAEVERKDLHANIKLGAGGIREIEFIVQAFQLVRGGRDPALRDTQLRSVLGHLGRAGLLPEKTAAALDEDYVFLRRLENALQMRNDEQTHELPEDGDARAALAVVLGFASWDALATRLEAVRARVAAEFKRVFAEPEAPTADSGAQTLVAALWTGREAQAAQAAQAALEALGFLQDAAGVCEEIEALRGSRLTRALSERSLQKLQALVAVLIDETRKGPAPELALRRALQVVGAVTGRSTYLTLLLESSGARAQLLRLCAASPWIASFIAGAPVVLDQLLDERALYALPEREEMRAELEARFANVAAGDTEGAMTTLRLFRQETMLRIAAADLVKALPLVKVSDRLTWLAETILQKTLARNREELDAEFGLPKRSDGRPASFAVIAYGKFGGIEMGYGSDLDIVFLHDCDALQAETRGGRKKLANEVWLSRLAQRIVSSLSAQTAAGRAYEVDLELRPDGRRGLTVSSFDSFAQYQKSSAWIWEHQALTRARPVAGEARLQEAFVLLRREVLTQARDEVRLRKEVREMREKMRAHLDKKEPGRFNVKQGEGGLTDIEFITQYLVLRHAHEHPALVDWPDNWRQAEALVTAKVLSAAQAAALIGTYREYRAWLHAADLQQAEPMADDSEFQAAREQVRALWREILGETS